jgi:hypothetical protein
VNNALNNLTNAFWQGDVAFYVSFMRHQFHVVASPSITQAYADLLLHSPWRGTRHAEQITGNWNHASLEMYEHFVKYVACGASDNDIKTLYTHLTTTEPKLVPGQFADITPSTWKNYRGWVISGNFDGQMFDLQNLNQVRYIPKGIIEYRPPERFIRTSGFWKDQSSSCLSGNAMVIMSDGSRKRIDTIRVGDLVHSSSPRQQSLVRKVAFVSNPIRGDRCLYSIDGSDWQTTAAHPFITVGNQSISFVSPDVACMTNPTWQAFNTINLSKDHQIHEFPGGNSQSQLVYDLVFEPLGPDDIEPFCYEVTDGKVTMVTASEAPSAQFFPAATAFVAAIINEVSSASTILPDALHSSVIDYAGLFNEVGYDSFTEVATNGKATLVGMDHVLAALASNQVLADSAEAIIGSLGLQLVSEIESGWRFADPPAKCTKRVVLVHMLRFFGPVRLPSIEYELTIAGTTSKIPLPKPNDIFDQLVKLEHFIDPPHLLDDDIVPVVINAGGGSGGNMIGEMRVTEMSTSVTLWDEGHTQMIGTLTAQCVNVGDSAVGAFGSWDGEKKIAFGTAAGHLIGKKIMASFQRITG